MYRLLKGSAYLALITTLDRLDKALNNISSLRPKKLVGVVLLDDLQIQNERKLNIIESCNCISFMRLNAIDEVIIDLAPDDERWSEEKTDSLVSMGIAVHIGDLGEQKQVLCIAHHNCFMLGIKRAFDIMFGLIGIIISLPIIAITAVPLLLESKGPLIFSQKRLTRNGRVFKMHKLRSMYVDAEEMKARLAAQNEMQGHMFKMKNDPRITKVGKTIRAISVDELPQFFDIFVGNMSVIGTRPPTYDEFLNYENHHKRRLSMRTGLTGMWQVSGRNDISDFEEIVQLDTSYIDDWSIWLDIKILFKTVKVVLFDKSGR